MTWAVLPLVALFVLQIQAVTLGAHPKYYEFYDSGKITCGGVEGIVNDDYCDCADGKDEPGTSACSNGQFYCLNKGYVAQFITSSRVQDGYCDCCDGNDEAHFTCVNNCKELAIIKNSQTLRDIEAHEAGLKALDEHLLHYFIEKTEKEGKKETLEKDQEEKKTKEKDVEQTIKQLEEKIEAEKTSLEASFKNDIDAEVVPLLVSWRERRQIELEEQEKSRKLKEEEDREAAEKAAAEAAERGEPVQEEGERAAPEPPPVVDLDSEQETEKTRLFDEIMKKKLEEHEGLSALKAEKKKVEDEQLNPTRNELSDISNQLSELNFWFGLDFGPDNRYAYMYGQTYSYSTPQYEYKFTAFKDAAQGHTSIGNWKEWADNYTVMKFDGGLRCWGGPDRSLEIHLECGSTTEIYDIREPGKCEYSMKAKTPGMCTKEGLQALRDKLV